MRACIKPSICCVFQFQFQLFANLGHYCYFALLQVSASEACGRLAAPSQTWAFEFWRDRDRWIWLCKNATFFSYYSFLLFGFSIWYRVVCAIWAMVCDVNEYRSGRAGKQWSNTRLFFFVFLFHFFARATRERYVLQCKPQPSICDAHRQVADTIL